MLLSCHSGTIQKGSSGTDTLVDIATALNTGDFVLWGTSGNDTFTLNGTAGSFISVGGSEGSDTFNLTLTGEIRRIYDGSWSDYATQGEILNLATGIVANDGFGYADTLNISSNAGDGYLQVYASNRSDSITGSDRAYEVYFLGAGNDTLAAGGGFDQLRFDSSNMTSAVTVDLTAGTATGSWGEMAFSHTISGLERVRGTDSFGDALRGSGLAKN